MLPVIKQRSCWCDKCLAPRSRHTIDELIRQAYGAVSCERHGQLLHRCLTHVTAMTTEAASTIPLYELPPQDCSRPSRCAYSRDLRGAALVIDNGSYACKAGWAGEEDPRLVIKSLTCRPKNRAHSQTRTCVGDFGPGLKGWDFGKGTRREIFDGDIPCQLEAQEMLLDWVFDRLSITGGSVDHPVLLTHPPLGPPSNKAAVAELLFEAYGVPSVQFAAPGPCAFLHSSRQGRVGSSGMVLASGHSSTYITAMHKGQPLWTYTTRSSACGALATQHFQQQLLLRYPQHATALTLQLVEGFKERYSYCAADYTRELLDMAADYDTAGGRAIAIQLPWVPPVLQTAEELAAAAAAKAARAEENRQRLRLANTNRRQRNIEEKQDLVTYLQDIADALEQVEDDLDAQQTLLQQANLRSVAELQKQLRETQEHLQRLQAAADAEAAQQQGAPLSVTPELSPAPGSPMVDMDPSEAQAAWSAVGPQEPFRTSRATPATTAASSIDQGADEGPGAASWEEDGPDAAAAAGESNEEFDLLLVPDDQLTPEQRKVKRRQQLLKAGRDARAKAKAQKEQKERDKVAAAAAEDEALGRDRDAYIAALQQRHQAAAGRLEAKRRKQLGMVNPAEAAAAALASRGRRTGVEQRERMRLMAQAVVRTKKRKRPRPAGGSESSSDEGFGEDDADWDVYKAMQGNDSGSGDDAGDEAEYAWTLDRLRQVGAELAGPAGLAASAAGTPAPGASTASLAGTGGGAGGLAIPGADLVILGSAAAAAGTAVPPGHIVVGVGPEGYILRPVTAEDYQVVLGVDRIRVPELLLQPTLAGVDQAGVAEIVVTLLKQMPLELRQQVVQGGLLLTGGNSAFEGLAARLQADIAACLPLGHPMKVVASLDPICDAWRGAALLARQAGAFEAGAGAMQRQQYEEAGLDYLQEAGRCGWPTLKGLV